MHVLSNLVSSERKLCLKIVEARPFNFDLATSAKKKDNWLAPDKSIFKINFESNLLLSVQKTTFKDC